MKNFKICFQPKPSKRVDFLLFKSSKPVETLLRIKIALKQFEDK